MKFKWIQLIHCLPKPCIEQIFIDLGTLINIAVQDHHLIKVFAGHVFEWNEIYIQPKQPKIVTTDSRMQIFQYKILHNGLYLNKTLFEFNKISSPE